MKTPWARSTWDNSIKANIALSYAAAALATIVLLLVWHTITTKPETLLVPPVVNEPMLVAENSANQAYLKSWGLYAATLIGNITEANVPFILESLSQFVSPAVYPDIRKSILAAAATSSFKDAAGSTKFVPSGVQYEASTNKVFVLGESQVLSAVGQEKVQPLIYEMEIQIKDKRPMLMYMNVYPGNQPHTSEWLKLHPHVTPSAADQGKVQ